MTSKDIGFVGLGIMGRPMAKNLIKAGYSLTVFDVIGTNVEQVVTEGANAASSAKEVAANTSLVITMVPDSADSEAAIMGPNGVLEGTSKGSVVIDMSSIAPGTSQKIGAACDEAKVSFLDAPVSGGEPGAIARTLAIMVGGKKDVFDRHVNAGVAGRDIRVDDDARVHFSRSHRDEPPQPDRSARTARGAPGKQVLQDDRQGVKAEDPRQDVEDGPDRRHDGRLS